MSTYDKPTVSAAGAALAIEAALAKADELGARVTVAVVDDAGVLRALVRQDGAGGATVQVATDKAYGTAAVGLPTAHWEEAVAGEPALGFGLTAIDRLVPLAGGVPIIAKGTIAGAVGVSGGSGEQDEAIAQAGAAACAPVPRRRAPAE